MTPDLPEALVQGRERAYLSWFYESFSWQRGVFDAADIDEYLRTYTQPGALRAGFAFYRNIPVDIADNRALLASGLRLKMPVLAVGGGREEARGRGSEPEASLRVIADDVTGAVVADCGHFVPEERPDELAALLLRHFENADGADRAASQRRRSLQRAASAERGRAGEARPRAQPFLDAQRLVPLRHALAAGERADLELADAPADRQVDDGRVLGLARARRDDAGIAHARAPPARRRAFPSACRAGSA